MTSLRAALFAGVLLALSTFSLSQNQSSDTSSQSTASQQQQQTTPDSQKTIEPPSTRPAVKGPDAAPDAPSTAKSKSGKTKEELEIERKEQSQKMLGVIPQYSVTSRHDAPALTPSEKFRLMAHGTVNPFEFVATGLQAALSQATNQFPEYGQGMEGYGKRYGAAFADQTSSQFFSNFVYPVLLKEDPRYFRLGEGTFKRRFLYSLEQEFVVVKDDRTRGFNFSNVLGAFTSGAISNLYYPKAERGWGDTANRSVIALVYGSVGGLADEFWPDVHDHWKAHKKKKTMDNQQ